MSVFVLLFLVLFSIYKAKKVNDAFYPLAIYSVPFLIQYLVYIYMYKNNNPVSDKTIAIYISSILFFVIPYLFFEYVFTNLKATQIDKNVVMSISTLKILSIITIGVMFINLGAGILTQGLDNVYRTMRYQLNYGGGMSLLSTYLPVVYDAYFVFWLINIIERHEVNKNRHHILLYSFVFFLVAFLSFSRTNLLMALCAFIYCMLCHQRESERKKRKKSVWGRIAIVAASVVIIKLFSWIADATHKTGNVEWNSPDNYFWKYLGYPLVTMDKYVVTHPSITSGTYTLGIFGKVLKSIGLIKTGDTSVLPGTGQFNVFSYIGNVYLDFGNFYFIAQMVIAMIVAYIYVQNRKNGGIWSVMYAFYSYAVFISFYSLQYSLTLFIYLFIVLCLIKTISKKSQSEN